MSPERTVGTYAASGRAGWGRLMPSSSRRCSGDVIADLLLAGSPDSPPGQGPVPPRDAEERPHTGTGTPHRLPVRPKPTAWGRRYRRTAAPPGSNASAAPVAG